MRRFTFFPLAWAITGLAWSVSTYLQGMLSIWIFDRMDRNLTDVYYSFTPPYALLIQFLTFALYGAIFGLLVAAIDFARNRIHDPSGVQSASKFIKSLKYGVFILLAGFVFFEVAVVLPMNWWTANRRYHAYPPGMSTLMQLAQALPIAFALIFIVFMVWKTCFYSKKQEIVTA